MEGKEGGGGARWCRVQERVQRFAVVTTVVFEDRCACFLLAPRFVCLFVFFGCLFFVSRDVCVDT